MTDAIFGAVVADLRARGVRVQAAGDRLRLEAPRGALGPGEAEWIGAHKPELLEVLQAETAAEPTIESMRCRGCHESMPYHPGGLCFACDLGIDRADFPTRLLPATLDLRAKRGPAGARAVRVEAIRKLATECRENEAPLVPRRPRSTSHERP